MGTVHVKTGLRTPFAPSRAWERGRPRPQSRAQARRALILTFSHREKGSAGCYSYLISGNGLGSSSPASPRFQHLLKLPKSKPTTISPLWERARVRARRAPARLRRRDARAPRLPNLSLLARKGRFVDSRFRENDGKAAGMRGRGRGANHGRSSLLTPVSSLFISPRHIFFLRSQLLLAFV